MNLTLPVNYEVVFLVHFFMTMGIAGIAACRIGKMHQVMLRVKLQYIFLFVAAIAYGFAPLLFQQWPPTISVVFVGAVLYVLWSDSYQWKDGPPKEAVTQPAELCEELPHAD